MGNLCAAEDGDKDINIEKDVERARPSDAGLSSLNDSQKNEFSNALKDANPILLFTFEQL